MGKVNWSDKAIKDLRQIKRYISLDKPIAAKLFGKRLFAATKRLELFPLSGRIVPEKEDPTLREIIFHSYRIIYTVSDTSVEIITVFHSSQLLDF